MKYTLLEMAQDILSSMDSDEINSINDNVEAMQVAKVIRTAYFNIISRADLPEHKQPFQLTSSGDDDQPIIMYKPENINKIEWIKYDTSDTADADYNYVTIVPFQQFFDLTQRFDPTAVNTGDLTFSTPVGDFKFYYNTDRKPNYCTILNDWVVVFDSYDVAIDTTLQENKTFCYGQFIPPFTMSDSFTPDMDERQFALLLNEAKSLAFLELRQTPHQGAVLESRRQWRSLTKNKSLVTSNYFDELPNFARRGRHVRTRGT